MTSTADGALSAKELKPDFFLEMKKLQNLSETVESSGNCFNSNSLVIQFVFLELRLIMFKISSYL